MFALIVAGGHHKPPSLRTAAFVFFSALANLLLFWGWGVFLSLPDLIFQSIAIPEALGVFVAFGIYSAVGAIVFSFLIDLFQGHNTSAGNIPLVDSFRYLVSKGHSLT